MKKKMLVSALAAGVMLGVVGCGGGSSEGGETIVGKWHKSCYIPTGSKYVHYRIVDIDVRNDGTTSLKKTYYNDKKCQVQSTKPKVSWQATYTTGASTIGDDGKQAFEIDLHGDGWEYYQMYRFLDNGNLLTSGKQGVHDGTAPEARANHFDPRWTGYTRVQ